MTLAVLSGGGCEQGKEAGDDLPIELASGARLIFDRGYISQNGLPGFTTNKFRGIFVTDVARRGNDVVVTLGESWQHATTYSTSVPDGIMLPNPGGGSSATYMIRSSDGGQSWSGFLPNNVKDLGGIGPHGWHLMQDSWLFYFREPGNTYDALRRYQAGGTKPVADPTLDSTKLFVELEATDSWLSGWDMPMIIGGSAWQSIWLEKETAFVDWYDVPGGSPVPPYVFAWGAAASQDGQTWYAVVPKRTVSGACFLQGKLNQGPLPWTGPVCIDDFNWSKALQGELWTYGQKDSRLTSALLTDGPMAIFAHKNKVWAYPLQTNPPDASQAKLLGSGTSWPNQWGGLLHARYDHLVAVVDPEGVRRYYDVDITGEVFELQFPANPCVAGRPCGGSSELVWASRVTSGQYDLIYNVDRTEAVSLDKHPQFYQIRVWPKRILQPVVQPPPFLDLGTTPERTATQLELACLAGASCGLKLQATWGQGTYGTLRACGEFFNRLSADHPRRKAMEAASLQDCPALLAAWEGRELPVVDPMKCPTTCKGNVLSGCNQNGQPAQLDCALEFRTCAVDQKGTAQCVKPSCDAQAPKCDGNRTMYCYQNELRTSMDCSALGLTCDPAKVGFLEGCVPTAPDPEDCTFPSGTDNQLDLMVTCLGDRYLTWCAGKGLRRTIDCQSHGYSKCEKQYGSYGPEWPYAQGQCK